MASYNKFNPFTKAMGDKKHNLSSDQLKIALTNSAPSAANAVLADITEISYTGCSSRNVTTTSFNTSGGTAKLICADLTLTASGTDVGPFQYVVLYNDTAANDELIGWVDKGAAITLIAATSETLLIDFDGTGGVLTIA